MHASLILGIVLTAFASSAAVITWTNTSNGNWNITNNWSPHQTPSTNDTALITNAGTYTVTLNINPTIAGLVLGGSSGSQTLATAEHTLTLDGHATVGTNGVILLSGGALSGNSRFDLQGSLNWSWGAIDTNAEVTVAAGGRIAIASGGNFAKVLNGQVNNSGVITWQPTGYLIVGGVLHNLADGAVEIQVDNTGILASGTNAVIINDGLFRKLTGGIGVDCYVPFINNGTVDIEAGKLNLQAPSVFNSGCQFVGAGAVNLLVGTNLLTGGVHSENLALLYNATLTGTGSISGTLAWAGGTIGEGAAITVATNGQLLISSAAQYAKSLNGALTNAGTIIWTPSGNLVLGGVLHNSSNALFHIQTGNTLIASGTHPVLINDGVLRRSVNTGTTTLQVPLVNNGVVDIQTGRLELPGGSLLNDGGSFTGGGVTSMGGGTNTLSGTISSENLELSGATLTGSGQVIGSFNWSAGTIDAALSFNVTSNSLLTIGSGANFTKSLNGNLTNAGTVVWLPTGALLLGGTLNNLPGGLFDIRTDNLLASNAPSAQILNAGTFRKSAGTATATCGPRLINNGTVEVASGRLTCAGGFSNYNGTVSLAGGTFQNSDPIQLSGGLLTGWGTVNADVTNAACIRPAGSNGVLTISGKYDQLLGGRMEFELAGSSPGTNQSRLNITGAATLRGTAGVLWRQGFVPAPGMNFPVVTFASRNGEFCCFDNCFLLGQGRRLEPIYTATSLTLSAVAASEPTSVPLRAVVDDSGALVHWPLEFSGYGLYWSTNLSRTNWIFISSTTNRYLEAPPLPSEKFFRLRPL